MCAIGYHSHLIITFTQQSNSLTKNNCIFEFLGRGISPKQISIFLDNYYDVTSSYIFLKTDCSSCVNNFKQPSITIMCLLASIGPQEEQYEYLSVLNNGSKYYEVHCSQQWQ